MISSLCTHRGRCTRCGCPYRDSRRGKRLVIDRTVSLRPDLNATAAVKNVARPNAFSHSMLLPERAIGTIGLKSAAIATKTTAHEYFPARIACLTSRMAEKQTTIATNTWLLAPRNNTARSNIVVATHFMMFVIIG